MVLHKHSDGEDTRFVTMVGPLANNPFGGWFGVIRIGTYQEAYEYIRWAYEPVSALCPDIERDSNSSDYGSIDGVSKDQKNPGDHKQEEVVPVPLRNPSRLRQGDKW